MVTAQEAFEFLGLEPDGAELSRLVATFITGASLVIDQQRGPILTRSLGLIAAGSTTPHVTLDASVTGHELAELYGRMRSRCSIGTEADPWATVPVARLAGIDLATRVVRLIGPGGVPVPDGSSLFIGTHTADTLPESAKLAALVTIRNRWQFEQAAVSATYDNPTGGTPWVIPMAALDLLAGWPPAGIA